MCRMTPLRAVLGGSLGIVAATTLVAQTPSQPQDFPTFRGGVQLIDVDVVVTGGDGKPVRGLTQDDFEIVEDNRPQQIRTFSVVDSGRIAAGSSGATSRRRGRHAASSACLA